MTPRTFAGDDPGNLICLDPLSPSGDAHLHDVPKKVARHFLLCIADRSQCEVKSTGSSVEQSIFDGTMKQ